MRCELFIGLGAGDTPPKGSLETGVSARVLDLIDSFGELDLGIGQFIKKIEGTGASPSETAVDMLIVAATVFLADTSISRDGCSSDGWTRRILLHIPVSDLEVWNGANAQLSRMLKFLTGDFWEFRFRLRPKDYVELRAPQDDLGLANFDVVSLFSGGLDSLVGAIDLLSNKKKPLLISHYWDGVASSAQSVLQTELEHEFGEETFEVIRGRIGANQSILTGAGSENSQRARSFLFYSMAAFAADGIQNTDQVLIPENGLIALNVPMDRVRLGSLSTRTAHPHFINSMDRLTASLGMSVCFSNPYKFKTKGEMVAECKNLKLLTALAPKSMSCSSPAKVRWEGVAPKHCGYCVPCMIRRASLLVGLSVQDQTEYHLDDLRGHVLDSRSAEGKDVRSFLYASSSVAKTPERARHIVRKPGPLPLNEIDDYADVYLRGMAEVRKLLSGVRARHG